MITRGSLSLLIPCAGAPAGQTRTAKPTVEAIGRHVDADRSGETDAWAKQSA